LICLRTLPSEEAGRYKFRDFHRDKGMPGLFEAFIRNFYKRELKDAQFIGREKIKWDGIADDDASQQVLPEMETDISIKIGDRKIIIEAKYYQEPMQKNRYDEKKLVSGNLYQLFAYLMNGEGKNKLDKTCEGILLYPVVEREHSYEYTIKGHRMAIKTINLNQNWKHIEDDLLALIKLKQEDDVN
jgi:5-methylcytosine-specific restriction enzyme subunit McrC